MVPVYATDQAPIPTDPLPTGAVPISPEQEQLIGLKFVTAKAGVLPESVRAVARIGLDETRVAHIQTKLDGYVDQILVKTVGTEVRKGQTLLTVYHPKSLAAQQEYLDALKSVMGLNEESGGSTGGPRPANAQGVMAAARLRLELMGFTDMQLETISKAMQPMWKLPVVAPITGVVTEVNALPRQRISPETLFTIADLSTVWATADLFGYQTGPIAIGQEANLRIPSLPGRVFHATVDAILPQVDQTTHTRKIRVRIDNPDRVLLPDMYGDLELRSSGARRAVTLPREAVVDRGLHQIVFVDTGRGYLEPRQVTTGTRSPDQIEILGGLRPGEQVVVSGNFLIDSESRLTAAGKGANDRTGH
jgi:RND family efflux transporter MFP subunit